jgi:hypothetical protein
MNITITQKQNDTLLTIEADFDKFVADNFNDICQALAKRFRILAELESVQRKQGIKTERLIEAIRRCDNHQAALELLPREFGVSRETANFILNASLSELNQILDPDFLQPLIKQYRSQIRSLMKLSIEYAMNKRKLLSDQKEAAIGNSTESFEDLEIGFYLTSVPPDLSGVPVTMFVASRNLEFSPRILLSTNGQLDDVYKGKTVSVSLDKVPTVIEGDESLIPDKVIEKAKIWVTVNYNLLMRHWNYEIDSREFLNEIKKI